MKSTVLAVLENVELKTRQSLSSNAVQSIETDAFNISLDLQFERSNVSRILNQLHKSGKLIKLLGRPTLFLSRKVLEQQIPNIFIPSSIPKNATLENYISLDKPETGTHKPKSFNKTLITTNSRLHNAYRKAKGAMLYPGRNLHVLVYGEPYVGKGDLIESMFDYAKDNQMIALSKSINSVDCKSFAPDHFNDLLKLLFRDSSQPGIPGLFESSKNSILVIRNIDALDTSTFETIKSAVQEMAFYTTDAFPYGKKVKINCRIIATLETARSAITPNYKQLFPMQIEMPALRERTIEEVLYLTLESLQFESEEINQTIRISKGVLSCLVMADYEGNISHLKSEIKEACANAYLKSLNSSSFFIDINFEDVSNDVLESINNINERIDDLNDIFNLFENDFLFFSPVQNNKELQLLIDVNDTVHFSEITSLQHLDNQLVDICLADINHVTSIQLNTIRAVLLKEIYNDLYPLLKSSSFIENENLLYGLLLHLSTVIKQIKQGNYSLKGHDSEYRIANKGDYDLAEIIRQHVDEKYNVTLPAFEIDYLATYHYLSSQWIENKYIQLLIISENNDNAKNYSTYLNSLNCKPKATPLEISAEMTQKEILAEIQSTLKAIDKGKGVIVASDSSIVSEILTKFRNVTDTEFAFTANISVQFLVSLVQKIDALDVSLNIIQNENVIDYKEHTPDLSSQSHAQELLEEISNKLLSESLIFLNPSKASNVLFQVLIRIIEELNIPYSDELLVKFIFHCSFLIERCIRKDAIHDPESRTIISSNPTIYFVIEKNFSVINETFSINVPNSELGMVINIFK